MKIGAMGFNHKAWKGDLYPKDIKEADKLLHYALHIPTVEINSTLHLMPRRDVFERWNRQTPEGFVFSFRIIKSKKFYNNLDTLHRRASETLGPKFGPISVLIPEGTKYYSGDAMELFTKMPTHKYALDIRSKDWMNDDVYETMARFNSPQVRDHLMGGLILANWEYVRLSVRQSLKQAGKANDLNVFAAEITGFPETKEDVFVYVDDEEGQSPNTILQLIKKLHEKWEPKIVDMAGPGPISYGPTVGDGTGTSNPQKATDTDDLFGPMFEKEKLPMAGKKRKEVQYTPELDLTFVEGPQANEGLAAAAPKVDVGY